MDGRMEINMYKIAVLGCENSHADAFLDFIYNKKMVTDVEVIGVTVTRQTQQRDLTTTSALR